MIHAFNGEPAERQPEQHQAVQRIFSRRAALTLFGSGGAMLLGAACGPSSPSAPSTAPTPVATAAQATTAPAPTAASQAAAPTQAAAQPAAATVVPAAQPTTVSPPRSGGTLRVGEPADIASLDGIVRGGYENVWLVYDRLVTYDDQLKPQPMLAESWDLSPDYTQIQLHLRPGVTWHTGREFTSDDVKWNLVRVQDPGAGYGDFAAQSSWFTTIDTPDKYTVLLKSDQSRPAMFDFFQQFNLVDQNIMTGPDAKTKASGTGPFMFVEWAPGDHITVTKNPNYWQTGRPYLDSIVSSIRAGDQPGLAALEGGQIDLLRTGSVRDVARLQADPTYQVFVHPSPGTFYEMAFLTTVPPFDNKQVRQAFNWAIDRQRLAHEVFLDFAQPVDLQWSPSSPAYDASKNQTYSYDLDKAKSLLQQAAVSNLQTNVIVTTANPLNALGFLQIYQAALAQLGVTLNIQTFEPGSWAAAVIGHNYNAMYATPDVEAQMLPISNLNGPTWRPSPNNTNWNPPEWQTLFNQAASEADPDKQKTLYASINDYILDQSWAMPISSNPQIMVGTAKLHGVEPNQYGAWYFTNAWLES
ncbi:MAG: ABC transporter substrate-binding protein [Chloroflexi bacterium]|nr:ABC transporter substrate-binding protein [Chloroflexota bacterium]